MLIDITFLKDIEALSSFFIRNSFPPFLSNMVIIASFTYFVKFMSILHILLAILYYIIFNVLEIYSYFILNAFKAF